MNGFKEEDRKKVIRKSPSATTKVQETVLRK